MDFPSSANALEGVGNPRDRSDYRGKPSIGTGLARGPLNQSAKTDKQVKHDVETIRKLNDNLRKTGIGGDFLITCGVSDLPFPDHIAVVRLTTEFDAFTPDNDPYGEHNFGSFEYGGNKFFWKIDYYDKQKIFGSPNPADPAVTHRVLTLMLAQDY